MNPLKSLQIPSAIDECISLMRSYVYIDKFNGCVDVRAISQYLTPGFILGVCGQIPFLYDIVCTYIDDAIAGQVYEVQVSNQHSKEMSQNYQLLRQLPHYTYTPTECDLVLSALLNAIIYSMFGPPTLHFDKIVAGKVQDICSMANIYPMNVNFPRLFGDVMKTTLTATPVLRTRIMSAMCYDHDFRDISVWALVKRYIWMQVQNYQMGTFLAIGEWYEAREKTLAHVDSEVIDEMKRYEKCLQKIKALVNNEYPLSAFRIFNPQSTLSYLRQFPASAHCAAEWKRKTNGWFQKKNLGRYGIDAKQLNKLLDIPVKYTFKRKLNESEINEISGKRFKQLDTDFTADISV